MIDDDNNAEAKARADAERMRQTAERERQMASREMSGQSATGQSATGQSATASAASHDAEAKARDDADRLRRAASAEGDSASREAGRAAEDLKAGAADLADRAKREGLNQAERGKDAAASTVDDFAASIRAAADTLGERDQSMSANLVREAASGLEQLSGALSGRSVGEIVNNAAGFARRQPGAFMIGAALAGIALGRFARASGEHTDRDYGMPDMPGFGGGDDGRGRHRGPAATASAARSDFRSSDRDVNAAIKDLADGDQTGGGRASGSATASHEAVKRTPDRSVGGTISGGAGGPLNPNARKV